MYSNSVQLNSHKIENGIFSNTASCSSYPIQLHFNFMWNKQKKRISNCIFETNGIMLGFIVRENVILSISISLNSRKYIHSCCATCFSSPLPFDTANHCQFSIFPFFLLQAYFFHRNSLTARLGADLKWVTPRLMAALLFFSIQIFESYHADFGSQPLMVAFKAED